MKKKLSLFLVLNIAQAIQAAEVELIENTNNTVLLPALSTAHTNQATPTISTALKLAEAVIKTSETKDAEQKEIQKDLLVLVQQTQIAVDDIANHNQFTYAFCKELDALLARYMVLIPNAPEFFAQISDINSFRKAAHSSLSLHHKIQKTDSKEQKKQHRELDEKLNNLKPKTDLKAALALSKR